VPRPAPLQALLRHPNLGVGAALITLSALAWLQLWASGALAAGAGGAGGAGAAHAAQAAHAAHAGAGIIGAAAHSWNAADVGVTLAMWLVMAVAMMLPAAAPAILAFADIARGAGAQLPAAERIAAFVGGYLAVWWCFGLLATAVQWALASVAVQLPEFRAHGSGIAGALLLAAGSYQFSALKQQCLSLCRSPLAFFVAHWRDGTGGAAYLGLRHGAHCLGCCWALMALMLIAGAMNIAWTAILAALMLAEKVLPAGRLIGRAIGVAFVIWGVTLFLGG
jgi:predicted metal-binding membrane protein